jgi:nitrogen fixation NifU-like protein
LSRSLLNWLNWKRDYNKQEMYSLQLLDHFQNPRNAGEISDADGRAEIENPACGDVLRITVKCSEGRIAQIRFKAKGCVATIACGSALTELATGRKVEEVSKLQRENINAAVGGLPQASSHAAQLALDTLSLALSRMRNVPAHA